MRGKRKEKKVTKRKGHKQNNGFGPAIPRDNLLLPVNSFFICSLYYHKSKQTAIIKAECFQPASLLIPRVASLKVQLLSTPVVNRKEILNTL